MIYEAYHDKYLLQLNPFRGRVLEHQLVFIEQKNKGARFVGQLVNRQLLVQGNHEVAAAFQDAYFHYDNDAETFTCH